MKSWVPKGVLCFTVHSPNRLARLGANGFGRGPQGLHCRENVFEGAAWPAWFPVPGLTPSAPEKKSSRYCPNGHRVQMYCPNEQVQALGNKWEKKDTRGIPGRYYRTDCACACSTQCVREVIVVSDRMCRAWEMLVAATHGRDGEPQSPLRMYCAVCRPPS